MSTAANTELGVLGWAELEAMFGVETAAELAGPDPWDDTPLDPLAEITRCERRIAMLAGEQLAAMVAFVHSETDGCEPGQETDGARDGAYAQIALCLGVAHRTSDSRVDVALGLAERLPGTLQALRSGELTLPKARVILEETSNLPLDSCGRIEPRLLALCAGRTPGALRRSARAMVERVDVDAATHRREAVRAERHVRMWPEADGMYTLEALLPAADAIAVYGVIDALAHANRDVTRDATGQDSVAHKTDVLGSNALRADALVDLILNPGGQPSRVRYEMRVLVPFGTLLGTEESPGHVPGRAPIPAETVRELASHSTWRCLLTDPFTGTALDLGAHRYTPSDRLAEFIRTRDQTCRFPGCRQPAHRSDLDHTIAFSAGGRTVRINLAVLCRRHHRVKHLPGWTTAQDPDGTLTFTTPHGHVHRTRPPTATGIEMPVQTGPAETTLPEDHPPPF
jgi:hypothetical protein